MPAGLADALHMRVIASHEAEALLTEYMDTARPERLRILGSGDDGVSAAANQRNVAVISGEPSALPRLELTAYLREQAVSTRYHRYGHMGMREVQLHPKH